MARGSSFIGSDKSRNSSILLSNSESTPRVGDCELSKEEKLTRYEKYNSTGDFAKDFVELCFFLGLDVQVSDRTKLPSSTPVSRPETRMNKIKDDKKNANISLKEAADKDVQSDGTPITYTLAEDDEKFFQPRIEIESAKDLQRDFIKGLYIRGLCVSNKIVDVLAKTVPELEQLSVLNMWNVGLTDETLCHLGKCLTSLPSLKTLCLDGNTSCTSQRFDIFLRETGKINLKNLSLRNCNLDETGAFHIGDSLLSNESLLTLNLCFNKLGNSGARHLANSLRMNRTLLSLNLSGNDICDEGVKHISDALSTFPLTHEQIVAKRFKMSNTSYGEKLSVETRPARKTSLSGINGKTHKDKPVVKKKDTPPKSRDSGRDRRERPVSTMKTHKTQRQEFVVKIETNKSPDIDDGYVFLNPLLEKVREQNGEFWIPGNRSLINLNLARNKISQVGVQFLHAAVKFQLDFARETNRQKGIGLMRISLKGNIFPLSDTSYTALSSLMKLRDPINTQSADDTIEQII